MVQDFLFHRTRTVERVGIGEEDKFSMQASQMARGWEQDL